MKSRFLEAFKAMAKHGKEHFQIRADTIIIEEIPFEEKTTKSGLVLAGSIRNHDGFDQNRPMLAYVLAVGEGYYDEEGNTVPVGVQPGDIILTSSLTTKWLSYFGPCISAEGSRIGESSDEHVHVVFRGQEGYEAVCRILGEAMETKQ